MKKGFILSIVFALFVTFVPTGFVHAEINESKNENLEPSILTISDTEKIKFKSFDSYNEETDEVFITVTVYDKDNNATDKNFTIRLEQLQVAEEIQSFQASDFVELDNFQAVLTDVENGNEIVLTNEEFQTYALPLVPLVVAFIAKQGLKAAIKKYGKSTLTKLLKENETVAKAAAKDLGYEEVRNQYSHNAKIYERKKGKGPKFISRDRTSHIGGAWKGARKIKDIGKKETRQGTYDIELNWIGD